MYLHFKIQTSSNQYISTLGLLTQTDSSIFVVDFDAEEFAIDVQRSQW